MPGLEYPGDPDDPGGRVAPERDEDPGQEQQRQDRRVDDRLPWESSGFFAKMKEFFEDLVKAAAAPLWRERGDG